jgi:hypothetical protein
MADSITAKADDKPFLIPTEDSYTAVCVDIVDCGEQHSEKFNNWQHKCAIIFQLDEKNPETGKRFELAERFSVTMGEKANLRKFLGQWRGKTYTNDEAKAGAPLEKLVGVNALVQVGHNTSQATGKVYANIVSIMRLPASMQKIAPENYERAEYWLEVKKKARQPEAIPSESGFEDFPQQGPDPEDEVPF